MAQERPAGPQPHHGPQRPDRLVPLPHPRPRRQVHSHVRRDLRRRGREDSQDSAADATGQLLCRAIGAHRTVRMHQPDADLQRTAPADGARNIRRPLQRPPPAPVPPATTTRPRHAGRHAPRSTREATESARRRDQRILQSRVNNFTNLQVRQHATSFGAVHRAFRRPAAMDNHQARVSRPWRFLSMGLSPTAHTGRLLNTRRLAGPGALATVGGCAAPEVSTMRHVPRSGRG
jgi:hypothetical protein